MTSRMMQEGIALLLICSLALSAALPIFGPTYGIGSSLLSHGESSVSPRGAVVSVPVLNERHQRQPAPSTREYPLAVPPDVIGVAPAVHGAVILTVRNDIPLDSRFVYTQTTSSRL